MHMLLVYLLIKNDYYTEYNFTKHFNEYLLKEGWKHKLNKELIDDIISYTS